MERSKTLISQILPVLIENIERTGDPLGLKSIYWTQWAEDLALPKEGEVFLFTSRMYQMLPFIAQTTDLLALSKPLMSIKGLGKVMNLGNRLFGEKIIRLKAEGATQIRLKGEKALKGIAAALRAVGLDVGYLYEEEPYSGILLHDLGLHTHLATHIQKVYNLFKRHYVKQVVTVDPHTTFILREIYPKFIENYDIQVKHYLEILSERSDLLKRSSTDPPQREFVIHDPCVMTRNLGMVAELRKVSKALDIPLLEPENTKLNTACCGGPVEYAFDKLTDDVATIRIKELASIGKDIIVNCPICLVNLWKYEQEWGIRIWDMGELL